jgi:ParB family chromosome partitioning protein
MSRVKGLGKGLAALMDEMGAPVAPSPAVMMVPIDLVDRNENQPRWDFDETALDELAASIRERGILQPLLLRPRHGGRYEIVAGERRWRAAGMAGLHEVPAVVKELDDAQVFEAALIENIQRADLNPLEEADAYRRLNVEHGHTQEAIAKITGKSRSHVANYLRILELPRNTHALIRTGQLSVGMAKLALMVPDPDAFSKMVVDKGMSVREAEKAANGLKARGRRKSAPRGRGPDTEALEESLAQATGMIVTIREGAGWGEVVFRYRGLDELDTLIGKLQA